MQIKVLGTGCANCKRVKALAAEVVAELNVDAAIIEVTDIADIMGYGVMSTPSVVINGKVVHVGGVPSRDKIEQWLTAQA